MGTGNLLGKFDSARNSHTLKSSRIFVNSLTPDCRVPHTVCIHVLGGGTTGFNAIIGIQTEIIQTVEIGVRAGFPPTQRSSRLKKRHPDRGVNTTLSPTTHTLLPCTEAQETLLRITTSARHTPPSVTRPHCRRVLARGVTQSIRRLRLIPTTVVDLVRNLRWANPCCAAFIRTDTFIAHLPARRRHIW